MDAKTFEKIATDRLNKCLFVLIGKGEEYSREGDRLWNFKRAGEKRNCHPAQALLGMKVKHDVSIDDIVNDLEAGILPSKEKLAEKINDSINYLLLIEGLVEEQRGNDYCDNDE